jgi:hypothetical protein
MRHICLVIGSSLDIRTTYCFWLPIITVMLSLLEEDQMSLFRH